MIGLSFSVNTGHIFLASVDYDHAMTISECHFEEFANDLIKGIEHLEAARPVSNHQLAKKLMCKYFGRKP